MDVALKICGNVPIVFFCDVGPLQGNRFGLCWVHFVRNRGRIWSLAVLVEGVMFGAD